MDEHLPVSVASFMQNYVHVLNTKLPSNLIEGIYIYGSITLGAFNEEKSDIDFIVLLKRSLTRLELETIQGVHSQMSESKIGKRMDGVYVQVSTLGKTNEDLQPYPFCAEGQIKIGYWDVNHITWWILKEHGITLQGTLTRELNIPTNWDNVIETLKYNVNTYWFSKTRKLHLFLFEDMVEFTTCTISRIICSMDQKNILSKDKAIEHCLQTLPEKWHLLLKEGARIRKGTRGESFYRSKVKRAIDCRNFILYTYQLGKEKYFVGE